MMGQEEAALSYLFRRYRQRKDSKQKEIEEKKKREGEERRKQREERSKIEEEINNLRRILEENDAKLKENKAKLKEVQQEHKVQQQEVIQSTQVEDEELDQEEENNPLEGHRQQVNVGVETQSEQHEVVFEPCEEKVLADEGELVTSVVAENICPDDGDVDTNDQKGKDVVQRSDAEEKTIDDKNEVFVDHYDALEIYKREADVGMIISYFYAGDTRLLNIIVPRFDTGTMEGIHSTIWNQNVLASGINSIILMVTLLLAYNWKLRKKIAAIQWDLNFFCPREYDAGTSHFSIISKVQDSPYILNGQF